MIKENTLDISVNNIISYIEDEEKINFDEPLLLKNGSRTWYIHGISPDLFDRKLNIFYSDDLLDIKKIDFYDFDIDLLEKLIDIITDSI
jgi:hypothetical protein